MLKSITQHLVNGVLITVEYFLNQHEQSWACFPYALQEASGHEGAKPQRVAFCENLGYLFTCGFSKMSARQYAVWDTVSLIFLKFINNK